MTGLAVSRQFVIANVCSERLYQESKWTVADRANSPGDFILYLERLVESARSKYVSPVDPVEPAMTEIRKVAAVAMAAMEKFGTGTPRPSNAESVDSPQAVS